VKQLVFILLISGLFSGCAIRPTQAFVYSDTTAPLNATSATGSKVGISDECTNILGIIATGDCSIESAKKNGNISSVSSVDWKGTNILGIYSTGRTIVRGN
jgi:hypothetical protein